VPFPIEARQRLKQFRELCDWVRQELGVREAILDGEVVALDPGGRQDFRGLLARRGNPATSTVLSRVFAVEGRGRDPFAAAERLDLEGIVAKRSKDPYAPATVWYKIKNRPYTQMEGRGKLFHPRGR
jgi:ATP-dependent DNA ligase